jgi:hypothetical protein
MYIVSLVSAAFFIATSRLGVDVAKLKGFGVLQLH